MQWTGVGDGPLSHGACPGEVDLDVLERNPSPTTHEWVISVGEGKPLCVVVRQCRPKVLARFRPHEYEIEVDGRVVERARGY